MRIIGGKYKGIRFAIPIGLKVRPTTDMAKESLFNVIENKYDLTSLNILDLFAGTGGISFEFASRGCNKVTCVEIDNKHIKLILSYIQKLNVTNIVLKRADVFRFLKETKETYDIIFADPPYSFNTIKDLPTLVFEYKCLKQNGVFILEHPKDMDFSTHPNFSELRVNGSVHFSWFSYK